MDSILDQRIARVLEHREREKAANGSARDHEDHRRRAAHHRVVSELARLASKISTAVAELNDRISDGDIWIKFEAADHIPQAEAIYTLRVVGRETEGAVLSISVDYTGNLRAMLRSHESRSLLEASTVFQVDRSDLMSLLLALLEAQYQ